MTTMTATKVKRKRQPKIKAQSRWRCAKLDQHQSICSPDQAEVQIRTFLQKFPQASGWLFQNQQMHRVVDGYLPESANITYAELVGGEGISLHIRPIEHELLQFTYLAEAAGYSHLVDSAAEPGVAPINPEEEADLLNALPGTPIYHRYWARDPLGGFKPIAYRFTGFREDMMDHDPQSPFTPHTR